MDEYIKRETAIEAATTPEIKDGYNLYPPSHCELVERLKSIPAADVKPVEKCKNIGIEYDEVDQFVCSECGIELQGWVRIERDEDDGDITSYEYRLRFCPNCGAKIEES